MLKRVFPAIAALLLAVLLLPVRAFADTGAGNPEPGLKIGGSAKKSEPKIVKAVAQKLSEAELKAENAILRKQVEELTAKLEKAKKTLAGVLDEI